MQNLLNYNSQGNNINDSLYFITQDGATLPFILWFTVYFDSEGRPYFIKFQNTESYNQNQITFQQSQLNQHSSVQKQGRKLQQFDQHQNLDSEFPQVKIEEKDPQQNSDLFKKSYMRKMSEMSENKSIFVEECLNRATQQKVEKKYHCQQKSDGLSESVRFQQKLYRPTIQLISSLIRSTNGTRGSLKNNKYNYVNKIRQNFGNKISNELQVLASDLVIILYKKISDFSKTKEQIIKYIFRKIFNPKSRLNCLSDESWEKELENHTTNLARFRTLNSRYIEAQFRSENFWKLFLNFGKQIEQKFDRQYQFKARNLCQTIIECLSRKDLRRLKNYKRLPWNFEAQEQVRGVYRQLKDRYISEDKQNRFQRRHSSSQL